MADDKKIREARRAASLTQDEVADAAGVTRQTVSRIERGLPVRPETRRSLAAAVERLAGERAGSSNVPRAAGEERLVGRQVGELEATVAAAALARAAELDVDEARLLEDFRDLTEEEKDSVLALVRTVARRERGRVKQ